MNESSEDVEDDEVVLSVRRLSPIANLTFRRRGALGEGELIPGLGSGASTSGILSSSRSGRRFCSVDMTRRCLAFLLSLLFPPVSGAAPMGFFCLPLFDSEIFPSMLRFAIGFCICIFFCCARIFLGASTWVLVFKLCIFGINAILFGACVFDFGTCAVVLG